MRTSSLVAVLVLATAGMTAAGAQQILPGGNRKQPVNITAEKLDYFDKEQKLVYSGSVVAVQGETRLKATNLVIYLTPKDASTSAGPPATSSQVRRMEAAGPVTIVSKDQIGTGDSGIYEKAANKVYLIGHVTLTQGPNVTKGHELAYDLTTEQAVVKGGPTGTLQSMFLPNDDSGGRREETSLKKPQKPGLGRSEAATKTR